MASTDTSSPLYDGPDVYPQAIVLSVLSCVAFILTSSTLAVHLKSTNHRLSTTVFILSISLTNLQNFINPLIWPNDDIQHWPSGHILCDVEAKLQLGFGIANSASATCICRHLASVLSPNETTITTPPTTSNTKRIRLTFDFALCILLPLYAMSVHILVQPDRYYIHGISGCQYSLYRASITLPLLLIWPILLGLLGTFYAILVLIRLHRHRREVSSLLSDLQTSKSRFLRVFALAGLVAVKSAPLTVYEFVVGRAGARAAWSWEVVHPDGWARRVVRVKSGGNVGFDQWGQVVVGVAVWVCFGLGRDARGVYAAWGRAVGLGRVKGLVWGG